MSLVVGELLCGPEVLKVLVVCDHVDDIGGALEIMIP